MKKYNGFVLFLLLTLLPHFYAFADRKVTVERYADIAFARTLQFPASVVNLQLADIAAETSGRILNFPLEVGDEVSKGQLLIEINCKTARINQNRVKAGLKRLRAQRELTKQQLDRAKRLSNSRSISRDELDQRQTQLDADNASIEEQLTELESAAQSVDYCQLTAPFTGTIIEKMTSVGSYVMPGSLVLKLLKHDAVEAQLELPTEALLQLQIANSISFDIKGQSYPLKLRKILPQVNAFSLQQQSRLSFTGKQKPPGGSLGLVHFETKRHYLPARFLQKRNGSFGVFIAHNNIAVFRQQDYAEEGQSVAIDLPDETLVISSQLQLLSDQETVVIQP